MHRILIIATGLAIIGGCARQAEPPHLQRLTPTELERKLDAATDKVPGVVFGAIGKDGKMFWRTAGMADLREQRRTSPQTRFGWFSITKLFTAAAILQLSEQGRVDLDAPAADYLPGLHLRREGQEATVRELLSHTAGVPNPVWEVVTWIHLADERGPTIDGMIAKRLGSEPKLDFVPGAKTAYSNLGYVVLGSIVERVSGQRYETYVEQNILVPLGCRGAGFTVTSDRATAYMKKWTFMGMAIRWMVGERFFAGTIDGYSELRPFTVDGIPHGGLSGPVDCLLRFARMTLQEGRSEKGRVLSAKSVKAMLTPTVLRNGEPTSVGLAWHLGTIDGEPFAMHDGGGGGYRADLRIYPRLGYAVAVMGNETNFSTDELARTIVQEPREQAAQ
jgi:D-alanyl-D-alanine carboxypeptidase